MPSSSTKHLPALDGIRAFAVFVVILYHSGVVQNVPGDLGVTAFFVLSGFLITWLLLREYDKSGTISLKEFYIGRTLRIFPAYYAFIILSLAADALLHHYWSSGLIASAFLYVVNYYNAFQGHPTTSVAHAWSLAVEEQFYLLWPLLLLTLWPKGRKTTRNVLVALLVFVVTWRAVLYIGFHAPAAYVYNAFDARCDALAVGCLMAICAASASYKAMESAVSRYQWFPAVTLLLIWLSRSKGSAAYHYSVGMTVDALLLGIFLIQMLRLSESGVWSFLNWRQIRWLGLISYPCYLYHGWGLSVGLHLFRHGSHLLQFVAGYAATNPIAIGTYYVNERPFLAIKERRRRLRAERPEAPAAHPGTLNPSGAN
jgi:peptidoglycan/LPS O-acetylase OafA/YrhL